MPLFSRLKPAAPTSEADEPPRTTKAPAIGEVPLTPAAIAALGSLSDLPVAGLTRRRIAILLGALVAAWVIVLFARQVGEASEASTRAAEMRVSNAQLTEDVTALERELELIQRQAYIEQQAREYRLGEPREIPFILDEAAEALQDDAPGTAASRLGAETTSATPLESWLDLLFAPPGDPARPTGSEDEAANTDS